jgi:hypothetical protein
MKAAVSPPPSDPAAFIGGKYAVLESMHEYTNHSIKKPPELHRRRRQGISSTVFFDGFEES